MADISFEVFDALKSVGVDDDKARRAAEALSGAATRSAFSDLIMRVSRLETKVGIQTWMIGTNIALTVAILLNAIFGG